MNAQRAKRLMAASAAGLLLAGGAIAGTASAATPGHVTLPTNRGCGWWGNCGYGYGPGYGFNNGFGPGYGYNNGAVVVIVVPG
ncbi:hypothetical protein [Streptomyces sp. NPDC046860]|uniref:hypothetical protein n=1 Tax=Streptomyces sp. NPDC046860 TaxID=3154495 RepID=UPI0033F8E72F